MIPYTQQQFKLEDTTILFLKYLNNILQNFDLFCKRKIKTKLENLYDIVNRYSLDIPTDRF